MKICSNCNSQLADNASFCPTCGMQFNANQQNATFNQQQQGMPNGQIPNPGYVPAYDPYDHTHEFTAKDISENKVIAMLVYLLGTVGIVIALLASNTSPYAAFHVRQALKISVCQILMVICTALLFWTVIVPIAVGIMLVVLFVIRIICFFQICSGKAKEPAIIKNLKFMR